MGVCRCWVGRARLTLFNLALKYHQWIPFFLTVTNKPSSRAVLLLQICYVQPLWPLMILTYHPIMCLWSPVPLVWKIMFRDLILLGIFVGSMRTFSHLEFMVLQVWVKVALAPGVQVFLHPCPKVIGVQAWRVNPAWPVIPCADQGELGPPSLTPRIL